VIGALRRQTLSPIKNHESGIEIPMAFPAFKEWRVIVEALGAGEQVLIIRKGGIAEGRGGFRPEAERFWLFPTDFHAQREKTKPRAAPWFERIAASTQTSPHDKAAASVTLRFFAELHRSIFLTEWARVAALEPHHLWSEETVRERFSWGHPEGVHVLMVRVHRLKNPVTVALTPAMSGCKSWVDVPASFDQSEAQPVLDPEAFCRKIAPLGL
jgi:hypothetical protein